MDPTRRCIAAILGAMRRLTRKKLTVLDLFDFEDGPRGESASKRITKRNIPLHVAS
jgi:hypothetical protein